MQERELTIIVEAIDQNLRDQSLTSAARFQNIRSLCSSIVETRNNEFITRLFVWAARRSNSCFELTGDLYEQMITQNSLREDYTPTHNLHLMLLSIEHFGSVRDPEQIISLLPPGPDGNPLPIHIRRLFSLDEIRNLQVVDAIHHEGKVPLSNERCQEIFGAHMTGGVFDPVIRDEDGALFSIFFIPILVPVGYSLFADERERLSWADTSSAKLGTLGIFAKAPRTARDVLFHAVCDAMDTTIKVLIKETLKQDIEDPLIIVEYFGEIRTEISVQTRISIHNPKTGNWIYRHSIPQIPSDGARWRHNRDQLALRWQSILLSAAPNIQPFELVEHSEQDLFLHVWFGPSVAFSTHSPPDGLVADQRGTLLPEDQDWARFDLENMKSIGALISSTLQDAIGQTDLEPSSFVFLSCYQGCWYPSVLIDFGIRDSARALLARSKIQPLLEGAVTVGTFLDARKWSRWELLPAG